VPFAERIRREAHIPTIAVGLITEPRQAEDILASGRADLIAIGRGMLYNPRWPWHAAAEQGEEAFYPPQYQRAHPSMRGDFLKLSRSK
jgi:2,4-dienoyl-CoA reductase-like NADH-dependent reductase (Old Yellow Enzyme family)